MWGTMVSLVKSYSETLAFRTVLLDKLYVVGGERELFCFWSSVMPLSLIIRVNRTYWAKKKKERDTALCLASQNLIDQESRANFEDALQKLEGIGQHTEAQLNKSRAKIQITKAVSGVADSIWEMHAAEQSLCQQEHSISNQLQSYSSVSSGNHQSGIETGRSEGWVDWTEAGKQLRHLDVLCPGGGRDSVINSLLCDGMPMPDVERRLHTLDSVQETQVWGGLSHQPSSRYSGHTMTRK
jgi:hypothetical protein